jgi:hypothetical protein
VCSSDLPKTPKPLSLRLISIIYKMDHIRQDLDELMGKDRNHPLHVRLRKRDHFDDE